MAHWIIEDKGFGGVVYRCPNCRESWNDYYSKFSKNICDNCGMVIDEDNEYVDEIKQYKTTDPTTKDITNFEAIKLMDIDELAKFLADIQYDSTEPPKEEIRWWLKRKMEGAECSYRREYDVFLQETGGVVL